MSTVNIILKTFSGELLEMAVNPDEKTTTIIQKLVISEPQFRCPSFVHIVRFNKDEDDEWTEGEIAGVLYDFKPKSYQIHDNGGVPFITEVGEDTIRVYYAVPEENEEEDIDDYKPVKGGLIKETTYEKVWIGDNELNHCNYTEKNIYPGNSILVHLSDTTYMYVGSEIYTFKTEDDDHIKTYFSPVGNNDVPYPYAIGEKMVYFMLEQKFVSIEKIDVKEDGYDQFYENFFIGNKESDMLPYFKDINCIQERI